MCCNPKAPASTAIWPPCIVANYRGEKSRGIDKVLSCSVLFSLESVQWSLYSVLRTIFMRQDHYRGILSTPHHILIYQNSYITRYMRYIWDPRYSGGVISQRRSAKSIFLIGPAPSGPMALLLFTSFLLFFYFSIFFFWICNCVYKSTGYSFHSAMPAISTIHTIHTIPTRLAYTRRFVHSYISPRPNKRPTNYRIDKTLGLWINFQSLSALTCTNLSNLQCEWQVAKDQKALLFLCFFSPPNYSI